jgi:plastocyanin
MGRFRLLVSIVASACGGQTQPSPLGPGVDATVVINGNLGASSYTPTPLQLRVGQTVNWKNNDDIEHTATLDGVFDIGRVAPHSAASDKGDGVTFRMAGTFTYHCTIHPSMVGTIVVQ